MISDSLDRLKTKCPACGHLNYPHRTSCDKCGTEFPKPLPKQLDSKERPGCVIAYAILWWGLRAAVLSFLSVGSLFPRIGVLLLGEALFSLLSGSPAIYLIFAILSAGMAYGLWNFKKWATFLVIGIHAVGIIDKIYTWISLVVAPQYSSDGSQAHDPSFAVCSGIIGLIIDVLVLSWFMSNKEYFD